MVSNSGPHVPKVEVIFVPPLPPPLCEVYTVDVISQWPPEYDSYRDIPYQEFDLALLYVDEAVPFGDHVRPICLPEEEEQGPIV